MIGGNASGRVTVPRSSVLIVSDVLLYRQGLASTLAHDERLHVVAAVRGDAAVAALHASPARAVLLDMSGPNSLNVARLLRRATPELRIIGFAISDDAAVTQCAEAGLAGFWGCDGSVDEIVAAVEHSLRGELVCFPRQVALLRDRLADLAVERSAEAPRRLAASAKSRGSWPTAFRTRKSRSVSASAPRPSRTRCTTSWISLELSAEARSPSISAGSPPRRWGRIGSQVHPDRSRPLKHDPEKWLPVFGKDHAQRKRWSENDESTGSSSRSRACWDTDLVDLAVVDFGSTSPSIRLG